MAAVFESRREGAAMATSQQFLKKENWANRGPIMEGCFYFGYGCM